MKLTRAERWILSNSVPDSGEAGPDRGVGSSEGCSRARLRTRVRGSLELCL